VTNTLAYWAHLKLTKKILCCEWRESHCCTCAPAQLGHLRHALILQQYKVLQCLPQTFQKQIPIFLKGLFDAENCHFISFWFYDQNCCQHIRKKYSLMHNTLNLVVWVRSLATYANIGLSVANTCLLKLQETAVAVATAKIIGLVKYPRRPWNTNWGGRFSTVDFLIKVPCSIKS